MDASPAKILVVDDNEANRALAEATLVDEGYVVVLAPNGTEGIRAFERESPDCVLLDVRMPDLDGFEVCTRIRTLPSGKGTPILFFTALRDVDTFDKAVSVGGDDFLTKPVRPTELVVRVQTALKLRRMGTELADQLALLRHQRDDLLRVQLQKERLMAFVVHDLKNPVNTMDLHAQLLVRDKTLPESVRESAAQIRAEARQLTRMILNLLDVSKADEGRLVARRAPLDLRALAEAILGELRMAADARKVELASTIEVADVRVDPDLFRRTLTNLVENAIRYAPQTSAVTLDAKHVDGALLVRIADRGKGIPSEMRERVFDAFVQVEAGATRTSRGLGLSFCRLAVEAHGGTIHVEDAQPGAAFCIRIPDGE